MQNEGQILEDFKCYAKEFELDSVGNEESGFKQGKDMIRSAYIYICMYVYICIYLGSDTQ